MWNIRGTVQERGKRRNKAVPEFSCERNKTDDSGQFMHDDDGEGRGDFEKKLDANRGI